MPFCGSIDFAVHFIEFRNIDLFYQGLYHLKVRIYTKITDPNTSEEKYISAVPYLSTPSQSPKNPSLQQLVELIDARNLVEKPVKNRHAVQLGYFDDVTLQFHTRTFSVKYCNEEVFLNEVVHFRLELNMNIPDLIKLPFYLEADLMYCNSKFEQPICSSMKNITAEAQAALSELFASPMRSNSSVEIQAAGSSTTRSVSYQVYKINNAILGSNSFLPIVFDECHFCVCNTIVNVSLVDIIYQSNFVYTSCPYVPRLNVTQRSFSLINDEVTEDKLITDTETHNESQIGLMDPPLNVNVYTDQFLHLFPKEDVLKIEDVKYGHAHSEMVQNADKIHQSYLKILLKNYIHLVSVIRWFSERCVTSKHLDICKNIFELEPLKLPGGRVIHFSCGDGYVMKYDMENNYEKFGENFYNVEDLLELKITYSSPEIQSSIYNKNFFDLSNLTEISIPEPVKCIRVVIPKLSARLDEGEPDVITQILMDDLRLIGTQILGINQQMIKISQIFPTEISYLLQCLYSQKMNHYWKLAIYPESCFGVLDLSQPISILFENIFQILIDYRKINFEKLSAFHSITDMYLFPNPETQPLLLEQTYGKMKTSLQTKISVYKGLHLFVLVHGFQGNSYDMRLIRNIISLSYPEATFLCSSINEDDTNVCIGEMGKNLALEIVQHIEEWYPGDILGRISFICHSLGGVIARAALPHMTQFWPKFHSYISLASPHLGYMYTSNIFVDAGMWVMKKWKNSLSLRQLTLNDHKIITRSFLYGLAANSEGFGQFKHICLISSNQDLYVPFSSARIEVTYKQFSDPAIGTVYKEMASGCLRYIKPHQLKRLTTNFRIIEKNFDAFIGRAAHIQFLENYTLLKMIVDSYPHYFI